MAPALLRIHFELILFLNELINALPKAFEFLRVLRIILADKLLKSYLQIQYISWCF